MVIQKNNINIIWYFKWHKIYFTNHQNIKNEALLYFLQHIPYKHLYF